MSAEDFRLSMARRDSGAAEAPAQPAAAAVGQWASLAVAAWLAGAAVVFVFLLLGTIQLRQMAVCAAQVVTRPWLEIVDSVIRQLRIRRPVMLLQSPGTLLPVTWGWLRPTVLVPMAANSWPIDRRRVVLLHELAHARRLDCLTQALAQLVCVAYWFHPAAWLAARQLRREREYACDDYVLRAGARASDYALHLLELVKSLRSSQLVPLGASGIARQSQLEGRLLAVLDPARSHNALAAQSFVVGLALACCALVPLSAARAVPKSAIDPHALAAVSLPPDDSTDPVAGHAGLGDGRPTLLSARGLFLRYRRQRDALTSLDVIYVRRARWPADYREYRKSRSSVSDAADLPADGAARHQFIRCRRQTYDMTASPADGQPVATVFDGRSIGVGLADRPRVEWYRFDCVAGHCGRPREPAPPYGYTPAERGPHDGDIANPIDEFLSLDADAIHFAPDAPRETRGRYLVLEGGRFKGVEGAIFGELHEVWTHYRATLDVGDGLRLRRLVRFAEHRRRDGAVRRMPPDLEMEVGSFVRRDGLAYPARYRVAVYEFRDPDGGQGSRTNLLRRLFGRTDDDERRRILSCTQDVHVLSVSVNPPVRPAQFDLSVSRALPSRDAPDDPGRWQAFVDVFCRDRQFDQGRRARASLIVEDVRARAACVPRDDSDARRAFFLELLCRLEAI